jgi:DNA-binding NarL/FixJ family response regulator
MTRILFLLDEKAVIFLETGMSAEDLLEAVAAGMWLPPLPYMLREEDRLRLRALRFGGLVIVAAQQPTQVSPELMELNLTPRQREVFQGMVEGLTTKQIAARLGLHPRTVAMHIAALKRHFGAQTLAQSAARGSALGLYRLEIQKRQGGD